MLSSEESFLSNTEPIFVNLLRGPGIDYQPGGPLRQPSLLYRPARLHRLAESIPRNLFLSSLTVYNFGLWPSMVIPIMGTERRTKVRLQGKVEANTNSIVVPVSYESYSNGAELRVIS
jgi:hypothetical protein